VKYNYGNVYKKLETNLINLTRMGYVMAGVLIEEPKPKLELQPTASTSNQKE
jgi:hypothetical protein